MKTFKMSFVSKLVLTLPVIFFATSITNIFPQTQMKETLRLEGLFYLDMKPIEVIINDGIIKKIIRKDTISNSRNENVIIAPGFIDNQVNGSLGINFTSDSLSVEDVKIATKALWKAGVTTYFPTVITNSREVLLHAFSVLAKAMQTEELKNTIPGFHMEGPYISSEPGFRGTHPERWIRKPDFNEFLEIYKASGKNILQITIAPETEDAIKFIEQCSQIGVKVGLGHHNASSKIITEAVDAGASISTHLGNGCANHIHRHNNPLWPQLSEDRLNASIICDGFHLTPEEIRTFYKVKGAENILLTSDASSLAGMPPGEYLNNEAKIIVTEEGMVKNPKENVLSGSASFINKGFANIMKFTDCSIYEAVQMVSTNHAKLYGFEDRGIIQTGKRADLVLFRMNRDQIEILKTYVKGKLVFCLNNI